MNPNLVSLHPSTFEQLQDSLRKDQLEKEIEILENQRERTEDRIMEKTLEIQAILEKYVTKKQS